MSRPEPLADYAGKTMAFGVVGDVMLVIHTHQAPDASEWAAHVEAVKALNQRAGRQMKNLVLTDGGAPDRSQSAALNQSIQERDFPTAVVISNPAIRVVISVLALWNWRIKSFAPGDVTGVRAYLQLDPPMERALSAKARQLSQGLSPNGVVTAFLGAVQPESAAS